MKSHEQALIRQIELLKKEIDVGERWVAELKKITKTTEDEAFLMQQQKRLSFINQQYRGALRRLDTYKSRQQTL